MWSVDDDETARVRSIESMKTFFKAHKSKKSIQFAYSLVVVGKTPLDCNWVSNQGLEMECMDLIVGPHRLDGSEPCTVPRDPRELQNGVLHVISLLEDDWKDVFNRSIDLLAHHIDVGFVGHRPQLIHSRGNHMRFLTDRVFLDLGIRQVLYLDNDVCVKASVDKIFKTPGNEAVVAAERTDSRGRVKKSYSENVDATLDFIKGFGFETSFNAGVVLLRTEAMCEYGLMDKMIEVQKHHNTIEQLWTKGTNQPPFEIASAKSLKVMNWFWNCRIQSGDLRNLSEFGLKNVTNLQWLKDCKIFHPSVRELEGRRHTCSAFHGLGSE